MKELDDEMLFELLLGANYLDLAPLLEICAAKIGLRMMSEFPLQWICNGFITDVLLVCILYGLV